MWQLCWSYGADTIEHGGDEWQLRCSWAFCVFGWSSPLSPASWCLAVLQCVHVGLPGDCHLQEHTAAGTAERGIFVWGNKPCPSPCPSSSSAGSPLCQRACRCNHRCKHKIPVPCWAPQKEATQEGLVQMLQVPMPSVDHVPPCLEPGHRCVMPVHKGKVFFHSLHCFQLEIFWRDVVETNPRLNWTQALRKWALFWNRIGPCTAGKLLQIPWPVGIHKKVQQTVRTSKIFFLVWLKTSRLEMQQALPM